MGAKVLTYIFLVFLTQTPQKTSAQCGTMTLTGSTIQTVSCCMNRGAGPPGTQEDVQPLDLPVSTSQFFYLIGLRGIKTNRGEGGQTGPPGPKGELGLFGPRGVFGGYAQTNTEFGTKGWPAETLCNSAPRELKSGTYYLGPTGKPITVYCNMATRETCIRTTKTTPEFNHDPSKGTFWLHEENIHLKNLYADISVEQLVWLRDRAKSVRQTLKYNCLDSVPHSKYNKSPSVKLWAWNDVVIGPHPTNESPVSYSVPEDTDKCVEGSTEWKSTIIELQSSNVYRLPIVDMWIGDVRNEKQKVTIESVELCFG